jgi:hypothetical protein
MVTLKNKYRSVRLTSDVLCCYQVQAEGAQGAQGSQSSHGGADVSSPPAEALEMWDGLADLAFLFTCHFASVTHSGMPPIAGDDIAIGLPELRCIR